MIYLHLGLDRTACESEASAQRLEACGWVRCSADVHAALWRIADVKRLTELANEARRRRANVSAPPTPPPLSEAVEGPKVVYTSLPYFRLGGV